MGLAILGVVLLLYILLAYFAAKTWQVWHVVLLVFLFLFSFVFVLPRFRRRSKVQQRWRTQYVSAMRDIETELQNNQQLTRGSLGGEEPGEMQLRGEVKQVLVDRGRIWRNLRLADLGDGQVLLDASAWDEAGCRPAGNAEEDQDTGVADEEPSGDAAAATATATPPSLGLDADAVVYAFKEIPIRALPEPLQKLLLSASASGDESDDEPKQQVGCCARCRRFIWASTKSWAIRTRRRTRLRWRPRFPCPTLKSSNSRTSTRPGCCTK